MARPFLSRDGPLLRPMSVRYYGAPEVDGPDGIGTIQQDGGGFRGVGGHPAQYYVSYARAPKSVIDLKSMQKYPNSVQGKPLVSLTPAPAPPGPFAFRAQAVPPGPCIKGSDHSE